MTIEVFVNEANLTVAEALLLTPPNGANPLRSQSQLRSFFLTTNQLYFVMEIAEQLHGEH